MSDTPSDPVACVSEGPVLLDLYSDGVAHIRLNRPDASNGLDLALLRALHDVLLRVHGDKRARAVLLTGEGRNFCAGGDVHVFLEQGADLPYFIRVATAAFPRGDNQARRDSARSLDWRYNP